MTTTHTPPSSKQQQTVIKTTHLARRVYTHTPAADTQRTYAHRWLRHTHKSCSRCTPHRCPALLFNSLSSPPRRVTYVCVCVWSTGRVVGRLYRQLSLCLCTAAAVTLYHALCAYVCDKAQGKNDWLSMYARCFFLMICFKQAVKRNFYSIDMRFVANCRYRKGTFLNSICQRYNPQKDPQFLKNISEIEPQMPPVF